MMTLKRKPVNKHRSSKQFANKTRKTKAANVSPSPMRGGIRL